MASKFENLEKDYIEHIKIRKKLTRQMSKENATAPLDDFSGPEQLIKKIFLKK